MALFQLRKRLRLRKSRRRLIAKMHSNLTVRAKRRNSMRSWKKMLKQKIRSKTKKMKLN